MENHFSPEKKAETMPERVTIEVNSEEEAIRLVKAFWAEMFKKEIESGRTLKQLITVRSEEGWLETITLSDRTSVEEITNDDMTVSGYRVHFKGNRRPISDEGLKAAQGLV